MTKFCCMSDLHGNLPNKLPECDAVLIAGDICGAGNGLRQLEWLDDVFRRWLLKIEKPVIYTSGNHDWAPYEYSERFARLQLPGTYLQDSGVTFKGLRIWASPWQKRFYDWAFNLEESELMGKWNLIPDDTDILICHSPPKYYGDKNRSGDFCGSESLTWRIGQLEQLQLMIFGHIHPGRGIYQSGDMTLVNAAMTDDRYRPIYEPFVVEIGK